MSASDIVIAGAGPAGSCAAALLARRGLAVTLLDRAEFPRPKLCGGYLSHKSLVFLERAFGRDLDSLVRDQVVDYVCDRYEILYRKRSLDSFARSWANVFVRREPFDAFLLEQARQAGAVVRTGLTVTGFDPESRALRLSDGRVMQPGLLIGADGANSLIRRSVIHGCSDRSHWRSGLAGTMEARFPRTALSAPWDHPMIHLGVIDWGYGWVFPNQDEIVVGICGLRARNRRSIEACFNAYLAMLGLDRATAGHAGSHPLPYGNWLEEPGQGRSLLIGDAAGLCDPVFGEGLYFAMLSGALAAEAVTLAGTAAPGGAAAVYNGLHQTHILPLFAAGERFRRLIYTTLIHLPVPLGRGIIRLVRPRLLEMVHGLRSFDGKRRTPCPELTVLTS